MLIMMMMIEMWIDDDDGGDDDDDDDDDNDHTFCVVTSIHSYLSIIYLSIHYSSTILSIMSNHLSFYPLISSMHSSIHYQP
jgi:hypothetical protein